MSARDASPLLNQHIKFQMWKIDENGDVGALNHQSMSYAFMISLYYRKLHELEEIA